MILPQPRVHANLRETLAGSRFVKATGPMGDWIVFHDATATLALTQEQVTAMCDRRTGIGGTGVVVVTGAQETSEQAGTRHQIAAWRSDGSVLQDLSEAARVGTGVIAALGAIDAEETSHHVFEAYSGLITSVYTPAFIGVDIGQWSYTAPETAEAAGSDSLVMTAGLIDPRPGLSVHIQHHHVTIAVETLDELKAIDLTQAPSIEPPVEQSTSVGFVVPLDPLIDRGMGQLMLRHYSEIDNTHDLASASAAAAVAFQNWSGLQQLNLWNVNTPQGEIVVQLHEQRRVSTFAKVSAVFFGSF